MSNKHDLKITVIRHTRVDVPSGICYGQSDVPLAGSYQQEFESVKAKLAGQTFGAVFSSPLIRCRRLAEDLFPEAEIVFDHRLKEINFGQWELQPWNQIYATPEGKQWMDNYLDTPCPGGESYLEFRQRVKSFITDLKTPPRARVAVIAHAGVIRLITSILKNQTIDEIFTNFAPEYGGVYEFKIKWRIKN
ncbi:alpha-ribazole phosphatase [Gaoshiqia sp. Z1-71]|uniref:alpha-ribazole phosphatase n=1 Tax=Gaoshiqia hydrogeniformans TaxID=3290090 RepID=UPI003BF7E207